MTAKPFDEICEIALGTAVDSIPERNNNEKIIVKSSIRNNKPKLRFCKRRIQRKQEEPVYGTINNSVRRPNNRFRNYNRRSAFFAERSINIKEIVEIENDIKKRWEIIKAQANIN